MGLQTDPVFAEKIKGLLEAKLAGYDALLARQKHLAGDVSLLPGPRSRPSSWLTF